jgi:hypothetical protein
MTAELVSYVCRQIRATLHFEPQVAVANVFRATAVTDSFIQLYGDLQGEEDMVVHAVQAFVADAEHRAAVYPSVSNGARLVEVILAWLDFCAPRFVASCSDNSVSTVRSAMFNVREYCIMKRLWKRWVLRPKASGYDRSQCAIMKILVESEGFKYVFQLLLLMCVVGLPNSWDWSRHIWADRDCYEIEETAEAEGIVPFRGLPLYEGVLLPIITCQAYAHNCAYVRATARLMHVVCIGRRIAAAGSWEAKFEQVLQIRLISPRVQKLSEFMSTDVGPPSIAEEFYQTLCADCVAATCVFVTRLSLSGMDWPETSAIRMEAPSGSGAGAGAGAGAGDGDSDSDGGEDGAGADAGNGAGAGDKGGHIATLGDMCGKWGPESGDALCPLFRSDAFDSFDVRTWGPVANACQFAIKQDGTLNPVQSVLQTICGRSAASASLHVDDGCCHHTVVGCSGMDDNGAECTCIECLMKCVETHDEHVPCWLELLAHGVVKPMKMGKVFNTFAVLMQIQSRLLSARSTEICIPLIRQVTLCAAWACAPLMATDGNFKRLSDSARKTLATELIVAVVAQPGYLLTDQLRFIVFRHFCNNVALIPSIYVPIMLNLAVDMLPQEHPHNMLQMIGLYSHMIPKLLGRHELDEMVYSSTFVKWCCSVFKLLYTHQKLFKPYLSARALAATVLLLNHTCVRPPVIAEGRHSDPGEREDDRRSAYLDAASTSQNWRECLSVLPQCFLRANVALQKLVAHARECGCVDSGAVLGGCFVMLLHTMMNVTEAHDWFYQTRVDPEWLQAAPTSSRGCKVQGECIAEWIPPSTVASMIRLASKSLLNAQGIADLCDFIRHFYARCAPAARAEFCVSYCKVVRAHGTSAVECCDDADDGEGSGVSVADQFFHERLFAVLALDAESHSLKSKLSKCQYSVFMWLWEADAMLSDASRRAL